MTKNWAAAALGIGATSIGYLAAEIMGRKKEKTREELESEVEKWETQTRTAQQIVIDVATSLSTEHRLAAELQEKLRLKDLKILELEKFNVEEHARYEAALQEIEELKAKLSAQTEQPK